MINKHTLIYCLLICIGLPSLLTAQLLPSGFSLENVTCGDVFDNPLALAFAKDGRIFVAEKSGRVMVIENGKKLDTPFLDIREEVLDHNDRGLLGLALAPNFPDNPWVYVLYTVQREGIMDGRDNYTFGRLSRYRVKYNNSNVADLESREVLIGKTWSEGFLSLNATHTVGSVQFAPDGTLLVSNGDGQFVSDEVDGIGAYPDAFGAGKFPLSEDLGWFRAQSLNSLSGKILRIDPETGNGIPSNPFYNAQQPNANRSKVWVYGLRNPYRFFVKPGGSTDASTGSIGTLFICDVGQSTWEEINIAPKGGLNMGWPCMEGLDKNDLVNDKSYCNQVLTEPTFAFHHETASKSNPSGLAANGIIGGAYYYGNKYPDFYNDRIFYADFQRGWVATAAVDKDDNLSDQRIFSTNMGNLVNISYNPFTEELYFLNIHPFIDEEILKLRYRTDHTETPPTAVAKHNLLSNLPRSIQFTGSGSTDKDGRIISYFWDFGDGHTSTAADPKHVYSKSGTYQVTLIVKDDKAYQDCMTISVELGSAPTATILSPIDGNRVDVGQIIELHGTAVDNEQTAATLQYEWIVTLVHEEHEHPDYFTAKGQTAQFLVPSHGLDNDRYGLRIRLKVTDKDGLFGTATHYLDISNDIGYCAIESQAPWYEWISRVTLEGIDNRSSKSKYSNFTAQIATLQQGNTHNLQLESSWSLATYKEYWKAWIDFDQNGIFEDTEIVVNHQTTYPKAGQQQLSHQQTIAVPTDALLGKTRMRIMMGRADLESACTPFVLGEVEDYGIFIEKGTTTITPTEEIVEAVIEEEETTIIQPTTTVPTATNCQATNLAINGIARQSSDNRSNAPANRAVDGNTDGNWYSTYSVASTNWENSPWWEVDLGQIATLDHIKIWNRTDCCDLFLSEYYILISETPFINNDLNTLLRQEGVTAIFQKEMPDPVITINTSDIKGKYVRIQRSKSGFIALAEVEIMGCMEEEATIIQPTTLPTENEEAVVSNYCESRGKSPWTSWISEVSFSNMTYQSDKEGYLWYNNAAANVQGGQSYVLNVTPRFSWSQWTIYLRAWIDYNQDGIFDDATERIFSVLRSPDKAGTKVSPISRTVSIPASALTGTTRMRIAMSNEAAPKPCDTFSLGEVEDYEINIAASFNAVEERNEEVAENVNSSSLTIYPNPVMDKLFINITNAKHTDSQLILYNILGEQLEILPITQTSLSVNRLPKGIYELVWLKNNEMLDNKRFVVE